MGVLIKTYAVVFQSWTLNPYNAGTEDASLSHARLRFTVVMILAISHHPHFCMPTGFCNGRLDIPGNQCHSEVVGGVQNISIFPPPPPLIILLPSIRRGFLIPVKNIHVSHVVLRPRRSP